MPDFETIGKYEVLELIGEGGFGVVYKARDPLMERLVAIKVCSTEDEQIRKRFLREAKIAGGLDHPNIVIAFDFGTEQDLPYLVQELLTGEDLRAIIDRQEPLGPDIKLRYLVQIAKGLQHAHAQGVWHRDIKPANVRILDDGRAKLMDFGMAKITNESGTRLTADGSVMGTAGYFAPEQLKALELDQRVDIFSYGVLAYELLTYRKVFPGETFMVVFRQVLHDEPEAIRSVWPDCPEELAEMVEKSLAKEPDDRFSSFDDILPILYSILSSASFDRRSENRGTDEPQEPSATVLKPLSAIASPTVVGPKPSLPVAKPEEEAPASPPPPAYQPEPEEPVAIPDPQIPRVEPEAEEAAPAPRPHKPKPEGSSSRAIPRVSLGRNTWIIAGVAVALVVVLGWWLMGRSSDVPAPPADTVDPVSEPNSGPVAAGPSIPTFAVFVDASPWGEILQIADDTGQDLPIPEPRSTPIVLELPEGSFVISVADPRSDESSSCEVSASELASEPCRIVFPPIAPLDYFKEAGWWE
jgi:serine/threonine-protein kinase